MSDAKGSVPAGELLYHVRTPPCKKVLIWLVALLLAAGGVVLWGQSRYILAGLLLPSAIVGLLDVAQRQVWVYQDRVEIQRLFTRVLVRERRSLFLEPLGARRWALRMKGRRRVLVILYPDNFKDRDDESRFVEQFRKRC